MDKYRNKYRIPSARASWWDYAANGCYFITICTANRECLFGRVVETHGRASLQQENDVFVKLSPIGKIVDDEWNKSFAIRNELFCDAYIIMPNHIHAVLRIEKDDAFVETHGHVETHSRASLQRPISPNTDIFMPEQKRFPRSISSFVAGFKSSATKQINIYRDMPGVPVWQTRFYDRIIRNAYEYRRIVNYINENPLKWKEDDLYESAL